MSNNMNISFKEEVQPTDSLTKLPEIPDKSKQAAETAKIMQIIEDQSPKINPDSPEEKDLKFDNVTHQITKVKVETFKTRDDEIKKTDKSRDSKDEKENVEEVKVKKPKSPCLIKTEKFMNAWPFQGLMTLITIYSLFGDDVRQLGFTVNADPVFYVLTAIAFFFFALEIVLACIAKDDYWMGFYFWLDLVSTVSLITDIGWIMDAMMGVSSSGSASSAQQATKLARAGRGARIGTKAGRVARVIRLIRLIRIVKLYKTANNALSANDDPLMEEYEQQAKNAKKEKELAQAKENAENAANGGDNVVQQADNIQHGPVNSDSNKVFAFNDEEEKGRTLGGGESNALTRIGTATSKVAPLPQPKKVAVKPVKEENVLPQESKVGKKLSDLTTRRVIILVLAMLISVPLFGESTYLDDNTSYDIGLKMISTYQAGSTEFNRMFQTFIEQQVKLDFPLILANCYNVTWQASGVDLLLFRTTEQQIATNGDDVDYVAVYDITPQTMLTSGLSIGNTFFICFILAGGALLFTNQCNDLVVTPIEQMILKVTRISQNPLLAAQEEENEALAFERMKEEEMKHHKGGKKNNKKKDGPMETVVLEQTIVKIGALLALGFGEAGSKIIAQNMAGGGDVNPMLPGQKIMAIFGFCDIRNFTDATEVLQAGVMLFVNEIGEIVHSMVDQFSGAANKNIGDAFLLVWKFLDEDVEKDLEKDTVVLRDTNEVHQLADMSVLAFLKIISQIKKSRKLVKYKENKMLNERMPNYSVKMGFGLHVGWAIEGAIGSFYKIDASYLSPNVNMASRLEAATKQFGVPLLISGQLYDIMTEKSRIHCRQIDKVTVKGSNEPLELYTCDVEFNNLPLDPLEKRVSSKEAKLRRVKARMARDRFRQLCFDGSIQASTKFEVDKDLAEMTKYFTPEFFEAFNKGYEQYLKGDWALAKKLFEKVEEVKGFIDYPTRNLIAIIEESHNKAPSDWDGYRVLTEK